MKEQDYRFFPERLMDSMKHVVSYRDMINDIEQGRKLPKVKL
jgi:hypothetical protein